MPRGDRHMSRWSKLQQIQVLVFHCHMMTSACTMHQFKQIQSSVFHCHAVTGPFAMHQFKQTQSLVFRYHVVTGACAMHQFKQTQPLIFCCHVVAGACTMHQFNTGPAFGILLPCGDRRMRSASVQIDAAFSIPLPRGNTSHVQCNSPNRLSLSLQCAWIRACAVNERLCVHLLCNLPPKLHWQYYII